MKKILDWEIKFNYFVDKYKNKPFEWGKWDCCKFANAMIKEITGEDLIPKTLKWNDEASALKAIKSYNKTLLKSIEKACKAKGVKQIEKVYVSKGDLVVYKEESELVGIHDGMCILSVSEDGIVTKESSLIIKAWNIDG